MEILSILKDPLSGVKKEENKNVHIEVQSAFRKIAEVLFNDYCINCAGKEYYFAEVEFYYFKKGNKNSNNDWCDDWNNVTYQRRGYSAGDLFYHMSGIDICFDSDYNDDNAKFGGILVRAVQEEDNNIISGPWNVKDELLNACHGGDMPKLRKMTKNRSHKPNVLSTKRALGKEDMKKELTNPYKLCFFDEIMKKNTSYPIFRYDKTKGKIVSVKRYYSTKRFDDGE